MIQPSSAGSHDTFPMLCLSLRTKSIHRRKLGTSNGIVVTPSAPFSSCTRPHPCAILEGNLMAKQPLSLQYCTSADSPIATLSEPGMTDPPCIVCVCLGDIPGKPVCRFFVGRRILHASLTKGLSQSWATRDCTCAGTQADGAQRRVASNVHAL